MSTSSVETKKYALLGKSGTGKTAIMGAIKNKQFIGSSDTTFLQFNFVKNAEIWDIPGIDKSHVEGRILASGLRDKSGYLLCFNTHEVVRVRVPGKNGDFDTYQDKLKARSLVDIQKDITDCFAKLPERSQTRVHFIENFAMRDAEGMKLSKKVKEWVLAEAVARQINISVNYQTIQYDPTESKTYAMRDVNRMYQSITTAKPPELLLQQELTKALKNANAGIGLRILGGFMMALGALALLAAVVALAMVTYGAALPAIAPMAMAITGIFATTTLNVAAISGASSLVIGASFFTLGSCKHDAAQKAARSRVLSGPDVAQIDDNTTVSMTATK